MPRNGSGTHSIPNTFSPSTSISSAQVNGNFSDLGSEITNSLPRDGQAAMTGQFKASNGTAALPGIAFGSDTNTGLFRADADKIGVAAGGTQIATFDTSGLLDANSTRIVGTPTGAIMMYGAITAPPGWVRMNGRTLGNASSGATERAHADTESLFTFLWTNYADTVCAVSTGRGASAAADYAAGKTIALPDVRGRAFFGLDDMGNSAAGRLGSVITSGNGASGGTETHTLTEAQLPAHDHGASGLSASTNVTVNNGTLVVRATSLQGGISGTENSTLPSGGTQISTITASATTSISGNTADAGSGAAHSNMPPAFLTTFIIKL